MLNVLKKNKVLVAVLLGLLFSLLPLFSFAHDAYFLQSIIDENTYTYEGNVIQDKASTMSRESQHIEAQLGDFSKLTENGATPSYDNTDPYKADNTKGSGSSDMPFTFPPYEVGGWFSSVNKDNATKNDADRARLIQQTLVPGLNDALKVIHGGNSFTSLKDMVNYAHYLTSAIQASVQSGAPKHIDGTNFTLLVGKRADSSQGQPTPDKSITTADYVLITDDSTSDQYEFVWKVPKGYSDSSIATYNPNLKDIKFKDITWNMLVFQANYAYTQRGYTASNADQVLKPSSLETAVVSFFQDTFDSLRNLLGLYSMNELIFNNGIRGTNAWLHGIMSQQWAQQALAYQWIFQALAWALVSLAIVKALIQRNVATINPSMRVSLIEDIQNLLLTGLVLASIVPLLNMFMVLNEKLVDLFATTAPNFDTLGAVNNYSNVFGGVLLQFFYFALSLYLNFVYIMRAITVAILMATAPLFVVTIAFGAKWRQLFNTWMREILGNIFLQSFHAFMLSFFVALSTSSRGIEGMVVAFSIIPLTEFFRGLVMGQGGGVSHALGLTALSAGASAVGGAIGASRAKMRSSGGSSSSSNNSKDSNADTTGNTAGKSDKIQNNANKVSALKKSQDSRESIKNKETPIHVADNENHASYGDYQSGGMDKMNPVMEAMGKASGLISGVSSAVKDNPVVQATTSVAKGAVGVGRGGLKVATGVAKAGVGTGMALALGGVSPSLAKAGMSMAGGALSDIKGGFGHIGSGAGHLKDSAVGFASMLPGNTQQYVSSLPNGDVQVHRNGEAMANAGINRATTDSFGNAVYTYNMSKLGNEDKANLGGAIDAFKANDKDAISYFRSQGIDRISRNGAGDLMVAYNDVGKARLGIKSVQTLGDGRIVETKSSQDPLATRKTFSINPYTPPEKPAPAPRDTGLLDSKGKRLYQ